MGRVSILHNGWACIYIRRRLYAFILTVFRTGSKTTFLSISQVNGHGLRYPSGQSDGSKCSAVIFSTTSLSSYLFCYTRASSVQNAGSHFLLLNLDFMHVFGAQTATISHSSFTIVLLSFPNRCELRRPCICNALGVSRVEQQRGSNA